MNNFEVLIQQNYRLKNQIVDLRNALIMNKDFLAILSKEDRCETTKKELFYKIIMKLTEQCNQAMLSNLELIQEKQVLREQIYKLNMQLDQVQARLSQEIQRNQGIDNPSEAKIIIHEQLSTLNNQLLAFQEEKMMLEDQLRQWKCFNNGHEKTQPVQKLNQKEECSVPTDSTNSNNKRTSFTRKYTSNQGTVESQKIKTLEKQISNLKQYIEELQNRLLILIKAYNYEQELKNSEKGNILSKDGENSKIGREIQLIKYATNEIKIYQRDQELYMNIRRTFNDVEKPDKKQRKSVRSCPKYKAVTNSGEKEEEDCRDWLHRTMGQKIL